MIRSAAILLFAAALLATACGDSHSGDAVPRRQAYQRIAALDTATTDYALGKNIRLALSSSADTTGNREGWLTARYAPIGATLYLSATDEPDEEALRRAVANRRQRISLNLGGAVARTDNYATASGFDCEAVVCFDGCATPVQFIATRGNELVSGAFVLSGKASPADSVRPVIEELEKECFALTHSLR